MCKLTLTRSKLRPDSSIARQSTYRAGEDRCADKHTAQTAQTRERRRLTTPKTHNLPRYSHATAKQTVCAPQNKRKSKPLRIADNTSKKLEHVALSNYQTNAATAATPTNLTTGKTRPLTTEGYRDRRKTTEYVSRQTHLFCRLENLDFKQYRLFRAIIHATKKTGKICSRSCSRLRSIR